MDWSGLHDLRGAALARWVVGALTGALLVWALVLYGTQSVGATFSDLGELSLALLAAVNCALAAWSSSGRLRAAWAAWPGRAWPGRSGRRSGRGTSLQNTPIPFPGLADLGFLGFPIGAVLALAIFPSDVSGAGRWRMTLDGLVIACAIGLVSWATALGAVVRAGGDSPLAVAVSVAYPASDIALLVVCVLVMSRSRVHRAPLAVIAAGLALLAVADSGFAYLVASDSYVTDSPIDLGWFFAFGLLALAALAPGATTPGPRHELPLVAGAAMPYVILGGSLALMTWIYPPDGLGQHRARAGATSFDPTPTVDELLMRADLAMYGVKQHGGGDVLLHTAGLTLADVDDAALAQALAPALAHGEITVSYQPIVDLATGRLHTLEALARWAPEDRPVPPERLRAGRGVVPADRPAVPARPGGRLRPAGPVDGPAGRVRPEGGGEHRRPARLARAR